MPNFKLQTTNFKTTITNFKIPTSKFWIWNFVFWICFAVCSLQLGFQERCFAQTAYLQDVPQGHYAYDAVYDLVKQGITGGFPDGTYRGKNLMTRFELAAFMKKFVKARALAEGTNEKLIEELKSEVSLIKYSEDK